LSFRAQRGICFCLGSSERDFLLVILSEVSVRDQRTKTQSKDPCT
jgi:hypothetical protein